MGSGCSSVKKSISSTTMRARFYSTTKTEIPPQCKQMFESQGPVSKCLVAQDNGARDQIKKKYTSVNESDPYFGLLRPSNTDRPSNIHIASIVSGLDSDKDKRDCMDDTSKGWTCTPNGEESEWETTRGDETAHGDETARDTKDCNHVETEGSPFTPWDAHMVTGGGTAYSPGNTRDRSGTVKSTSA